MRLIPLADRWRLLPRADRERAASLSALALAVVAPLATAWATAAWRDQLNATTVAVVLAGVVVTVAASGRRAAAVVAAGVATASFDYFHTVPYGSLTMHQADEGLSAAVLLAVGLLAAGIQTRSRRRRAEVVEATAEISRIGAVTDLVASGRPADEIVAVVAAELTDLLHLRGCAFDDAPPDPFVARIERTGAVTFGDLLWRADVSGLPGDVVEIPVTARGRHAGRFVGVPRPGVPVSYDRRIVAVALADQAGAALAVSPAR